MEHFLKLSLNIHIYILIQNSLFCLDFISFSLNIVISPVFPKPQLLTREKKGDFTTNLAAHISVNLRQCHNYIACFHPLLLRRRSTEKRDFNDMIKQVSPSI